MFKKKEMGMDMPAQEIKDTGGEKAKLIAQWQRDGREIKHLVPDFDLNEAIENPEFAEALSQGKSVFEAYALINKKEEMQKPRREIYQNGQHARRGTGGSVVNPAKMSREDFKKYIDGLNSENA